LGLTPDRRDGAAARRFTAWHMPIMLPGRLSGRNKPKAMSGFGVVIRSQ